MKTSISLDYIIQIGAVSAKKTSSFVALSLAFILGLRTLINNAFSKRIKCAFFSKCFLSCTFISYQQTKLVRLFFLLQHAESICHFPSDRGQYLILSISVLFRNFHLLTKKSKTKQRSKLNLGLANGLAVVPARPAPNKT